MKPKTFFGRISLWLRAHYHWVQAAVMFLMIFSFGGASNNLTSLHIIPVTETLGVGRESFSLAMGAKTFAAMLSTFFSGFLITRLGARLSSTLGLLAAGGAYLLLARLDSLWMLALGGGILGLVTGFCSTSAASHVTRLWFHRYQGTVLGVITAATGLGGSVMCIPQTAVIKNGSFRSSFNLCAGVILVSAVLFFLFARNHPQDMGLAPLGEGEAVGRKRRSSAEAFPGFPMKRLWRRPSFYLMMLCTFLSCFSMYMAYSTIRSHMIGCGFSEDQASAIHSGMLLLVTGTKILTGILSDRLGAKPVNVFFHVMAILGLALFAYVENYGTAILAMVLYTCALPLVTVGIALIAFSLFGYRAQSEYTGIFLGIISVSNFTADYASNFIFTLAGSYRPAFLVAAGIAAVALLFFFILYRLCEKDKRLSMSEAA